MIDSQQGHPTSRLFSHSEMESLLRGQAESLFRQHRCSQMCLRTVGHRHCRMSIQGGVMIVGRRSACLASVRAGELFLDHTYFRH